jgi:integrase/recombinase XerC
MGGVRKRDPHTKGLWKTDGGHFHGRLRDPITGKPKWVPLGTDRKAAIKKLSRYKGGDPIPSRVAVADAAAEWLKLAVATRRNEKGQELAATWVDMYLCKYFTGLLGSIDGDSIRAYRLWLEKKDRSANTVARILSDLRAFLNWAADSGKIERSPFPRRVMPRIPETLPNGFTDEERATLVALPEPYGFVLRFLLGTGLRWNEARSAQAADVKEGLLEVEKTKNGKVRRVPLPTVLAAEVRSRVGRLVPFDSKGTASFNKTVCRLSGVKDFHVHRTRHDYAIQWLADDGSLATLQELLGHAHISTTMRYARITEGLVKREADRVFRGREGA